MRVAWRHGVALVGCVAILMLPVPEASPAPPEVIYHNGVVLTMEAAQPRAEAIAVRNGRILAIGDDDSVLVLRKRPTRVVDLGGRTVLPGFIDSHAHWIGDGLMVGLTAYTAIDRALRRGWTSINELFVNQGWVETLRVVDAAGELRLRINAYLPVNFENDKFGTRVPRVRAALRVQPAPAIGRHQAVPRPRLGHQVPLGSGRPERVRADRAPQRLAGGGAYGQCRGARPVSDGGGAGPGRPPQPGRTPPGRARHPGPRRSAHQDGRAGDDRIHPARNPGDLAAEAGFPELLARGQTHWIARWRDLVESGVRTIGSSDMPWLVLGLGDRATDLPHGSPLEAVYQAVTRQSYSGRPPEDWQLAQRLTVDQALRLFTIDAAYATFEEDVKGSLSPGKHADLVILSADPTTVAVSSLLDIQVLTTIVGGQVQHCANTTLC